MEWVVETGHPFRLAISNHVPAANKADIIPIINIFSFPEGKIIDNFSVELIEKEVRVDGVRFCRIWGNSEIYASMNYVVVNDCLY